jgi:hypothetical protein
MLFKKHSTSSEGCPEKFGRSSKRALRAFVNNVVSAIEIIFAIEIVFEVNGKFGIEVERDNVRGEKFVMIEYGSNFVLFFLTCALVPVAVVVLLQ